MAEAVTHDYRNGRRGWGYEIAYRPTASWRLHASGWGLGIARGDFVLLTLPDGGETRYRVESISYMRDPPDQWFGTLSFAPRNQAAAASAAGSSLSTQTSVHRQ